MKIICFLLLFISPAFAGDFFMELDSDQIETIYYAEQAGKEIGYPETLVAIVWQETHAGSFLKVGSSGELGAFQIKYKTAKYMLEKEGVAGLFTPDQLLYNLIFNKKFNATVAKLYFSYLINKYKDEPAGWSKAVLAYNVGPTSVNKYGLSRDPNNYVHHIREHILKFRKANHARYN